MSRVQLVVALAAAVALSQAAHAAPSFAFLQLSDLHVGEGCPSPYDGSEDCYSVQNLRAAVAQVNGEVVASDGIAFVLVTGDITSSAEPAQFAKAAEILATISVPVFSAMGNHDTWAYDAVKGDETSSPQGDQTFASTFAGQFSTGDAPSLRRLRGGLTVQVSTTTLGYANATVDNPENKCRSNFQNFELRVDDGTPGFVSFVVGDWNTREAAVPGWNGTLPMGTLFNFTGGTFPWLQQRLAAIAADKPSKVFIVQHQPYRCPVPIPDWAFCFSKNDKAALRTALAGAMPVGQYWGLISGHTHLWGNGTAFDQAGWETFRQWTSSACKGDGFDHSMSSSMASFNVVDGETTWIRKRWRENGVWKMSQGT